MVPPALQRAAEAVALGTNPWFLNWRTMNSRSGTFRVPSEIAQQGTFHSGRAELRQDVTHSLAPDSRPTRGKRSSGHSTQALTCRAGLSISRWDQERPRANACFDASSHEPSSATQSSC